MAIRAAAADELGRLEEIELAAGKVFETIDMADIASDDPLPLDELDRYRRAGRAWVHTDDADRPVAYLIADVVDGAAHIEQVSVDPVAAGRGLGRELIEHVATWAAERGLDRLTLTTFVDVAWNGPYYRRLGFRPLPHDALGPGLRRIREEEIERGLDRWPRQAMERAVSPGRP